MSPWLLFCLGKGKIITETAHLRSPNALIPVGIWGQKEPFLKGCLEGMLPIAPAPMGLGLVPQKSTEQTLSSAVGLGAPSCSTEPRPCRDPSGRPPEHLRSLGAHPPQQQHWSSAGGSPSSGDDKPVGNAGATGAIPLDTPLSGGDPGVPHWGLSL